MPVIVLDIETHDPYISRGLGSGWVYKLNIPSSDYEVLGTAVWYDNSGDYITDLEELKELLTNFDTIICHNAQYDIGGLLAVGIGLTDKTIYDTEIMGKLYNSALPSHALDYLGKLYCNIGKDNSSLTDAVWEEDLYPWLKKELKAKTKAEKKEEDYIRTRPDEAKLEKFCKNNMKLIQEVCPEAMSKYAIRDAHVTYSLFKFFSENISMVIAKKYSELCKICIDYRTRGVRIDLKKANDALVYLEPKIADATQKVYDIAGKSLNLSSTKELPALFDELKISYPYTAAKNPSITSKWLATQPHEICKAIIEAKKLKKISNDFIKKIIDMQEFTCPSAVDYGRVYPELHLLRARTGRFSCTSPNLQQIPARDKELSVICRGLFVAEEGEKIYSLDFSSQESRLQVHYAYLLKCEGADLLQLEFKVNPNYDLHQKVADIAGIDRGTAKTVNLGLSYGMGSKTLAKQLSISESQSKLLIEKYNNAMPFLSQLNDKCMLALKMVGTIKTLGGRLSHIDPPLHKDGRIRTFEYKALNKLIQGSAADQTIEAMIMAHKEGINVLFPVHDQLLVSLSDVKQAERLKVIMETCIELTVPMVVDVDLDGGDSWATSGH